MGVIIIKFILLILFVVLVGSTQVFAQNQCAVALSHSSDTRIGNLSNEDQDIILMASLIASQLQPSTVSTIQINLTLIFLGAITEVKVDSEDKGVFHDFSLIDGMLFTILKRLGILEATQTFLLSQLGFNDNNLGPFKKRPGGGLTLHFNIPPTASMATHFDYDETVSAILDTIGKSTLQNVQEGSTQSFPTFSQRLLLIVLDVDIPLRTFLFEALDKKNALEVRSLLYPLFNDIRLTETPSRRLFQQLISERSEIVQQAIRLIQQGMSVPEAAEKLGTHQIDFQKWLDKYQQEHGIISIRQPQSYTHYPQEQKEAIIQEAIKLFQEEGMTTSEAARRLNMKRTTLQKWLNEHEQKHGLIHGRPRKARSHSQKK